LSWQNECQSSRDNQIRWSSLYSSSASKSR
jgi:hypothetical protein